MNYKSFAKKYAAEINGDFSEYDEQRSVIVIQLPDERYQAVQGRIYTHKGYGREVIELKSTVCKEGEKINFHDLLAESTNYVHSKFVIEDGYLRVEASAFMDNVNESRVKEMIQEAGNLADQWEFRITGKDIF
jgi:hypothetical protein